MNRTEQYKLQRSLVELENAVNDLVKYCEIRTVFDEMMGCPMKQITGWFGSRGKNDKSGQRD